MEAKLKRVNKVSGSGRFIKKYMLDYELKDKNGDSKTIQYELASRNDINSRKELASTINAVSIICKEILSGKFILLREFRYAVNDYVYDFPAGLVDKGETIVDAAVRELYEETGIGGMQLKYIMDGGFSSAGMTDERVAICYGELCDFNLDTLTNSNTEGIEDIQILCLNLSEISNLCNSGAFVSSRVQNFLLGTLMKTFMSADIHVVY